ncbi:MAG TPA: hypothetical protein VHV10_14310 [Ktedonobacteraceae bacterium]|jgi:hypothetical protein|nr:hypothetical protein [Ktedonobacteraceae bacterium]
MDQFLDRGKGTLVVLEGQTIMNPSMVIQSQLLATKFFVPVTSGTLISRPCLSTLLDESLKHPLTFISAPAGFGKTMLLSAWAQSLPASHALAYTCSVFLYRNGLILSPCSRRSVGTSTTFRTT